MAAFTDDFERRLLLARGGDASALGQVLEACRGYLLLIARRQLEPDLQAKGGASDLVQETFFEAQRDFAQFHGGSEAELLAWLRRLLLNNLANFSRSYRSTVKRAVGREVPLEPDGSNNEPDRGLAAGDPSPSSLAAQNEQAQALWEALARLPDDHRQVIQLRYLEERSFEEIGRLMNRSSDAARKLWARAMERLRQEWEGPL
jgi:RNA polymerase sigma-70 factor (ECF subfamily)